MITHIIAPGLNVTTVAIYGTESDQELQAVAWAAFCNAHPHEAYDHDPERFWAYFQVHLPGKSREEMREALEATR